MLFKLSSVVPFEVTYMAGCNYYDVKVVRKSDEENSDQNEYTG